MEIIILILLGVAGFTAIEKYQKYSSRKGEREYRRGTSGNINYNTNDFISPQGANKQNIGNNIRKQFNCELIDDQTNRAMERSENCDTSSPKKITASYVKQPGTLSFSSDNTLRYVPNSKKDSLLARVISTSRPISLMSPEDFVKAIVETYSLEGVGIKNNDVVNISRGNKDIKTHLKELDLIGKRYPYPTYCATVVSQQGKKRKKEEKKYISIADLMARLPDNEYSFELVQYVQELGKFREYLLPEYFPIRKAPNTIRYPENKYYYSVWLESDTGNLNDSRIIQVFFLNEYDRQSFIQEYNSLPKNNN